MHPALLTLFTLTAMSASLAAEDALVAHPKITLTQVDEALLRDLFSGKRSTWKDGTAVSVILLKDGPSHQRLLDRLRKSQQQFQTGWKKLVFTGSAVMPEQVATEEELVAVVAKTPGAIGWIDSSKRSEQVKVLSVTQ
jgi:ABC-type phosphate transport system substrate-binding protein